VPCSYLLDREGNVVSVVRTSDAADLAALKGKAESMIGARRAPPQAAGMQPLSGGDSR
jgi:hypothetical protein